MFNGPSPLAYPATYGKNMGNNYSWSPNMNNINMSNPQEVELMMRQKFSQNNNANNLANQSDPYQEFQMLMSSCSPNIKYKIMNNEEYIKCDQECELLIKQAIEEAIIPQILSLPQGRVAFEKFLGVAKKLKDKYIQEEVETAEQFQKLMKDEIVQQRLKELSGNTNNKMEEVLNVNG